MNAPRISTTGSKDLVWRDAATMRFEHPERRCVVTGIGLVTPMASTLDALCDAVEAGESGFSTVTRFDVGWCEAKLACAFPETDYTQERTSLRRKWMDRAAWYVLDALENALRDSGLTLETIDPDRIAVALGTSHSGIESEEGLFLAHLAGTLGEADPRQVLAALTDHVAAVVAAALGARGVRRTMTCACASSTGAMGMATDLLKADEADIVITGGSDTVSLSVMAGFNSLKALAPEGCRPFSMDLGITLGEGAGIFIVERLDRAVGRGAPIRAEIIGYAMSGDAHHATAPDESGDGIRRVIEGALADAGVEIDQVDYVSAHGTGTQANDVAESRGTASVFGARVPVSSTKSIFGHTLGASGVIETALVLGMAERDRLPPTQRFNGLREDCVALDYVPNTPREARTDIFVCNNYGFGGSNASVVFRRHPAPGAPRGALPAPLRSVVISSVGAVNARHASGPSGLIETLADVEVREDTRFLVPDPKLPPEFKRMVGRCSPSIKFGVIATGEAIGAAALDPAQRETTGIIFSAVTGPMRSGEKFLESVFAEGPVFASAHHFAHTTNNALAGQISICYGLKGYNTTLSGPAGALGYAASLVAGGRQARVIVGGADEHTELLETLCDRIGLIAKGRARPFGPQPGIHFGEGAASILFEDEAAAAARGHAPMARLLGFAEAQDGAFVRARPGGHALIRAIERVLHQAGRRADEVDVVIANGTGPARSVAAEANALKAIFGARSPRMLSLVTNAGTGPSHTPIASVAAAAALVSAPELPAGLVETTPNLVLVVAVDLTGVSCAALVSRVEART